MRGICSARRGQAVVICRPCQKDRTVVLLSWIAFIAAGLWVEPRDPTPPLCTVRGCCGRERFFQRLPSRAKWWDGRFGPFYRCQSCEYQVQDGFHVVILDEAQDLTACQAAAFWGDEVRGNCIAYLIGDQRQRIYRWTPYGECGADIRLR